MLSIRASSFARSPSTLTGSTRWRSTRTLSSARGRTTRRARSRPRTPKVRSAVTPHQSLLLTYHYDRSAIPRTRPLQGVHRDHARAAHHGLGRPHALPLAGARLRQPQEAPRASDGTPEASQPRCVLARRPVHCQRRVRQRRQALGRSDRKVRPLTSARHFTRD